MISPPVTSNRGLYGKASRDALKLEAHQITMQGNSIGCLNEGVPAQDSVRPPKFYEIKEAK